MLLVQSMVSRSAVCHEVHAITDTQWKAKTGATRYTN